MTHSTDDEYNSSTEEEITEEELLKMQQDIQDHIDFEWDFFKHLGKHTCLYQFDMHTHPNVQYWKKAPLAESALFHLYQLVDQSTLDIIKSGLDDYRDCDIRATGVCNYSKDQIVPMFHYATMWVDANAMGKNDYVNDICWVVSKMIHFQTTDRRRPKSLIKAGIESLI